MSPRLAALVVVVVLWACAGSPTGAVENRGGAASPSCDVPVRLDFEARRYGNLDADQADYQTWSPWRVGIQLASATRGTLTMIGDELQWTFDFTAKLERERCTLELWAETHDPIRANVDLRARTGTIRSIAAPRKGRAVMIDDVWQLGPPFPAHRP